MWDIKNDEDWRKAQSPLQSGNYEFEVTNASKKTSDNGNAMVELDLKVYVGNKTILARDWLVNVESSYFKRKSFWQSTGYPEYLNNGPEYFKNQKGKASFIVKEYTNKDGVKSETLRVKDYLINKNSDESSEYPFNMPMAKKDTMEEAPFPDDDIPF